MNITLTPHSSLILEWEGSLPETPRDKKLVERFADDWRGGLFDLAADKNIFESDPTFRFWQQFANQYLTQLSHIPEEEDFSTILPPNVGTLQGLAEQAPPMKGLEYLSQDSLEIIWSHLNDWVEQELQAFDNIHTFLSHRAPKWVQVGRVCFHLAENIKDPKRPFAFLSTYSVGYSAQGKLIHLPLKKALKQYAGDNNHKALIKLLSPVQKAAECYPWVEDLINSGDIYHPLAWTIEKAYQLLSSVDALEECGLAVRVPNWWKKRPRPQVSVTLDSHTNGSFGVASLLNFSVDVALGNESLTEQEVVELLLSNEKLVSIRGQWVEINKEKLQETLDHWKTVQIQAKSNGVSFIEGMRLLAGVPTSLQDKDQEERLHSWVKVTAGKSIAHILEQIRNPASIQSPITLPSVQATLRPYQKDGVNWLCLLSDLGLGACLADDMGLGKTLQILSLLAMRKETQQGDGSPSLLVVPASLLGNWKSEACKFTPSLNLFFLHPSEIERNKMEKLATDPLLHLKGVDLVVTTYSMLARLDWLAKVEWDLLVLDEAQAIKNAGTKQSRIVRTLSARAKIALTGTPIENSLSDLWSLFDFINPGLLGTFSRFKEFIKQIQGSTGRFDSLKKLVSPYILRRMKTDPKIISDLPEKVETSTYCCLSQEQVKLYVAVVNRLKHSLETVKAENRRGLVLQSLLQLKQICNHPAHFSGDGNYSPASSGKFLRLKEICEELAARQDKVLIFTQFKEIIDPISEYLGTIFGKSGLVLHGQIPVKQRKQIVEAFQSESHYPFFVLSLKAGGTGLNLTAASHVIHFDRWWNPAVENQATDRAFRIGQKKSVQVHKFITQGTVEEEIDKLITSKKRLSDEMLHSSDEVKITELSNEEILQLVSLDLEKATVR